MEPKDEELLDELFALAEYYSVEPRYGWNDASHLVCSLDIPDNPFGDKSRISVRLSYHYGRPKDLRYHPEDFDVSVVDVRICEFPSWGRAPLIIDDPTDGSLRDEAKKGIKKMELVHGHTEFGYLVTQEDVDNMKSLYEILSSL
jgi:hypothetical protein